MNSLRMIVRLFLCILAAAAVPSVRAMAEDYAIVVGVGKYANLPDAALPGIDVDVNSMVSALSRAGFKVNRLFNSEATEEGIRKAFATARDRVGANDRFIYYQSSHGSRNFHLLTHDSIRGGKHMLGRADIQSLMHSIPSQRKSLILDACFSGGFLKERGDGFRKIKYFDIGDKSDEEAAPSIFRDRSDTVVRALAPSSSGNTGARDFVVFASSQDNQPSRVDQIGNTVCSVFTYFLVRQLEMNPNAVWNAIVQSTIYAVRHQTANSQAPAFDSHYLGCRVFTTDETPDTARDTATPVRNMADFYNLTNTAPAILELSARLEGARPAPGAIYYPGTHVHLRLHVGAEGYLFLINRDDQDMVQMFGWGKDELDFGNLDSVLSRSRIEAGRDFEYGEGNLTITTSSRKGIENWKAFLFTNAAEARQFAQTWLDLVHGRSGPVQLDKLSAAKLDEVTRIVVAPHNGVGALYTSEVHYRVTNDKPGKR